MQTDMVYLGLGDYPALFTALNKDTGEIYAELVPYVPAVAQRASDKGVMVISSASPEDLPRVSAGRTDFRCKRCNWSNRCWSAKAAPAQPVAQAPAFRSEEHTSELQSLMRISYADFCLKKKK